MSNTFDLNKPEDREKIRRLFRVKKTEGEMLATRGYTLNEVYLLKNVESYQNEPVTYVPYNLSELQSPNLPLETILQLQQKYGFFSRQSFSSLYYNPNNRQDLVLVLYLNNDPDKVVNKEQFKIVENSIQTGKFRHIILITEIGLSPDLDNAIRNNYIGYKIEVFLDIELAFNITKHALVPIKIYHVPAQYVAQWAQSEGLQPDKLPMIQTNDKVAKFYGANSMDGFQFEIMGTTTDTAAYYRIARMTPAVKKQ